MTGADGSRRAPEYVRAERRLRELELQVMRRLDGMLQGDYRGLFLGPGTEAGESRLYQHGDDVRRMDWKLTARVAQPHVRDTIADRDLELWMVVDQSASLQFGTTQRTKWDLSLAAVAAAGFLTARGGNRVGAVTFGAGPTQVRPPRAGRDGVVRLLHELDRPTPNPPDGPDGTLAEALDRVRRLARHRGLVAIVSDFLFPGFHDEAWARSMRVLRGRFELLVFEVVDPRELELPSVGMLTLTDPETGRQLELQTSRSRLRARYAQLAAEQRETIAAVIRGAGGDRVRLRTDGDWVLEIARFVARRRAMPAATQVTRERTA